MSGFIIENLEEIVDEWESFARTVSPASATMDPTALRDHVKQMLEAIAEDIGTAQSSAEQEQKSKGLAPDAGGPETAAETHGALRHTAGFDLSEIVAEFRALRASVLRLWVAGKRYSDPASADEITRFNEAIDQALAESVATYSEELTKSRETFLAILGHDLRSPLAAIAGVLQILSQPVDETARTDALAAGRKSVAVMGGMIQDLLEYTRTRLGKGIPITRARANLASVCSGAIREISLVHPQTAFRFESGGNLEGVFDGARMHQVVSNLLSNAVQHGRRGSAVSLICEGDDDRLAFRVNNQGVIPAELRQVIFDPMVRIPAQEPGLSGTTNLGLGLFIAREIILAHGGKIDVASSAQAGTTFSVEFPRD